MTGPDHHPDPQRPSPDDGPEDVDDPHPTCGRGGTQQRRQEANQGQTGGGRREAREKCEGREAGRAVWGRGKAREEGEGGERRGRRAGKDRRAEHEPAEGGGGSGGCGAARCAAGVRLVAGAARRRKKARSAGVRRREGGEGELCAGGAERRARSLFVGLLHGPHTVTLSSQEKLIPSGVPELAEPGIGRRTFGGEIRSVEWAVCRADCTSSWLMGCRTIPGAACGWRAAFRCGLSLRKRLPVGHLQTTGPALRAGAAPNLQSSPNC